MEIAVRPMREPDALAVSQIVAADYELLAEREGYSPEQLGRLLSERSTEAYVRDGWLPRWGCYVAESTGEVVGALVIDGCDVGELWVSPRHLRQGVGRALFRKAEEVIAAAGHRHLALCCAAESARPFYEAMGAKVVDTQPCPFGPLEGWPITHYRKELHAPTFVPGLDLAEAFFREAVEPVLESCCPGLQYSAALIGTGSEVLGFDTEMSTDHCWGPQVTLFLDPQSFEARREQIDAALDEKLPPTFRGYPTRFAGPSSTDSDPIGHRVETFTLEGYFESYLSIDIQQELTPADWLTLPHQKLRSVCAGRVFRDDLGLQAIRERLSWYPHDVWLYVLASCWARIGQEEHLMGRAGHAGDEIGSALIGSRLVRDIMRLAFMMERVYPPYAKWLGTAFHQLECAGQLEPVLTAALHAKSWQERESNLCAAYSAVAEMHHALGLTEPLPAQPSQFWERPFKVIQGDVFASALMARIKDPATKVIAERRPIGSIDLFSDSTDLLEDQARRLALRRLFR